MRIALTALLLLVAACGASGEESSEGTDEAIKKVGTTSPPWLYEGPLPKLESPSIVVSIAGHTARVTGLLPQGYDVAKLPFHATQQPEGDRVRVHVVYPVATGKMIDGKWNNVPGHYDHLNVRPYRPNDTSKEHWGGFPFLNYHDDRRFALHGPIDFVEDFTTAAGDHQDDWRLIRGRISMGCQRMQGEHVLELTHLVGFDMSKPWTTAPNKKDPKNGVEGVYIPMDLTVLDEASHEPLDRLDGAIVDVDYPKDATVPPLPEGEPVKVFRTWDANDMKSWACAVKPTDDPNRVRSIKRDDPRFDKAYCARNNGPNRLDPSTGNAP